MNVIKLTKEPYNSEQVLAIVTEWKRSRQLAEMIEAERYYINDNDINDKRRFTFEPDEATGLPIRIENPILNNAKVSNGFLNKLIDQKVAYNLTNDFIINYEGENTIVPNSFKDFTKRVRRAYVRDAKPDFVRAAKDAVINGIGYLYIHANDEGKMEYKRCDPKGIIPVWGDVNHTKLLEVIRYYYIPIYTEKGKQLQEFIEYYTEQGVKHMMTDSGHIVGEEEKNYLTDKEGNAYKWNELPWAFIKYNDEEKGLLNKIKPLIDAYDRLESDYIDMVADTPNSVMVVKNYDGLSKAEFMKNASQYRTIFVDETGDAKTIEHDLNATSLETMLTRLRKDIFTIGAGIDIDLHNIGNVSGVALKVLYSDLSTDSNFWQTQLRKAVEKIINFIKIGYEIEGKPLTDETYYIEFDTDEVFNEQEIIQNCSTSVDIVSTETILANHPWVKDVFREEDIIKKENTENRVTLDYAKAPQEQTAEQEEKEEKKDE